MDAHHQVKRAAETMPLLEFAEIIGISTTHAYDLARNNQLPVPVYRAGQKWLVSRRAVEAMLDARQPGQLIHKDAV